MSDRISDIFADGATLPLELAALLFHGGDPVRRMFLVEGGEVTLSRQTAMGAAVILQRAGPGQVVAEASAYAAAYHCDARASAPSTLRALPLARFHARLADEPALARAWSAHLAQAVQSARMRAEIRTLRTVADRLDVWLGDGSLPEKGRWQDLAAELGVTREALYRELGRRRRGTASLSTPTSKS